MSTVARQVLEDCRLAKEFLEQATTDPIWRIHWVAAIALVRTVGDVLHKVDYPSGAAGKAVAERYAAWKSDRVEHKIFWEFIRQERNLVLHEYRSSVHPGDTVPVAVEVTLANVDDGQLENEQHFVELDENIYRPMQDGSWEGDDARDVLQEAIDWWEFEINLIDDLISGRTEPE